MTLSHYCNPVLEEKPKIPVIIENFEIISKIGSGSFGKII